MPQTPATAEDNDTRLFVSVQETAHMLGLSRQQTYDLLDKQGGLRSKYFGRRRLVVLSSVHAFANGLPDERPEL